MVKHTQAIRRLLPTNCLSVNDHFMGLALKRLILETKVGDDPYTFTTQSNCNTWARLDPLHITKKKGRRKETGIGAKEHCSNGLEFVTDNL